MPTFPKKEDFKYPMTPFSLADTFEKLANDPSWPWTLEPTVMGQEQHKTIIKWGDAQNEWFQVNNTRFASFVAQSPLTMARLALMVMELTKEHYLGAHDFSAERHKKALVEALKEHSVTPSHYANVKKRVEEADTEEK